MQANKQPLNPLWVDECAPQSMAELAVHPKKLEEIKLWLQKATGVLWLHCKHCTACRGNTALQTLYCQHVDGVHSAVLGCTGNTVSNKHIL